MLSGMQLFGHEIVILLVAYTWGLWEGFAITAAGTIVGELANFLCVPTCSCGENSWLIRARAVHLNFCAPHVGARWRRAASRTRRWRARCARAGCPSRSSCAIARSRGTVRTYSTALRYGGAHRVCSDDGGVLGVRDGRGHVPRRSRALPAEAVRGCLPWLGGLPLHRTTFVIASLHAAAQTLTSEQRTRTT
jgi:hypothetical protein